MDERRLEADNERMRQALQRIVHFPVPRVTGSTSPMVALETVRDAMAQMRAIARDGLKNYG